MAYFGHQQRAMTLLIDKPTKHGDVITNQIPYAHVTVLYFYHNVYKDGNKA